jgi:hypothetical protein
MLQEENCLPEVTVEKRLKFMQRVMRRTFTYQHCRQS